MAIDQPVQSKPAEPVAIHPLKRLGVPISSLGMVLGLGGLSAGWRVCSHLFGVPLIASDALAFAAFAAWATCLGLWLLRWLFDRPLALAEWRNPVTSLYFALLPMSTLIAAIAIAPHLPATADAMLLAGVCAEIILYVVRLGPLWLGEARPADIPPVIFMPAIGGSFVCAIACGVLGHADWGMLFFGVGMLSWMGLESVLLQRLFTSELPAGQRASMGIFYAPPSSACVAYLALTSGAPDIFAHALFGHACFLSLIMLRLLPWLMKQPFSIGYWAYSFGVTAMPLAALRFVERGETGIVATLALPLFAAANLIIALLVFATIRLLLSGGRAVKVA